MRKIPQSITKVIHLLFLAINLKLNPTPFEESIVDEDIPDDWLSNLLKSLSQIDDVGFPPKPSTDNDNEQIVSIEETLAPETATEGTNTHEHQTQVESDQATDGETNINNLARSQAIAGQVQQLSTSNTIDPNILSIL